MSKKEIYRKASKYLIKFSILFLIITSCFVFFFLAKRIKEPRVTTSLLFNIKDAKIDSALFNALDESFILGENIKDLGKKFSSEDDNFLYFKILPQYSPLTDMHNFLPLEMYLYKDAELVPFKEDRFNSRNNLSWYFALDEKKKLLRIDARDMYLSKNARYSKPRDDGMFIAENAYIYSIIELPVGLKEFRINAASKRDCAIKAEDFDYSAAMEVRLDGGLLGVGSAKIDQVTPFSFNTYVSAGWHKIEIAFTNDIWQPERGWDRNLLVKDLEIYDLLGVVYLKVKKVIGKEILSGDYNLSYLRALNDSYKNDLIRFFKTRFNIENLRDIVINDFSVYSIIKNVEINNLIRSAIFAPASTKIKSKIKVPIDGTRLTFSFGVMPEAWDKPGDGVEFRVRLDTRESEPEDILFSKYINPKSDDADRKWFQGEVDLIRFKGKEISLIFETRGSPVSPITPTQDCAYDWAVWSD